MKERLIINYLSFAAIFTLALWPTAQAHDWEGNVVVLKDSNFQRRVLESEDVWLVNFYAPWCPHCKNLKPVFEEASRRLEKEGIKNVKFGALDASEYQSYASKFNIRGYPTLKFFPAGQKSETDAQEFDGDRSAGGLVSWAKQKSSEIKPPPELKQLTSEKILKDTCESAQLCIISVLPHLYDCQSECRNRYIQRLKDVAETFKTKSWAYLWVEATVQPELEKSLDIGGFGYPALAAMNIRKMAFSLMRGSFSQEGITDFLKDLSYGHGKSAPIKGAKLPKIVKSEKWDGKDLVVSRVLGYFTSYDRLDFILNISVFCIF